MKKVSTTLITLFLLIGFPVICQAQIAQDLRGLHSVLDNLYNEMMPLCSQLIGIARGLAGFAALFYIANRVWKHLSNSEPIDFYPLFRPFVLGFCILNFPMVIAMINGVMKPTVTGTAAMVDGSNKAIETLLKLKEEALMKTDKWNMYVGTTGGGDRDRWYKYTYDEDPGGEGWMAGIGNDIRFAAEKAGYNFRHTIKEWMSEVLKVLFEAAALCINTLRTFQLVVLSILGPLVFGFAVFDGFQHTLTVWLARYINIFLWLPIANIFGSIIGKIQENMIKIDLEQIGSTGNTDVIFGPTETGYLIFMIIGIVGYFTVPSVANYIVHAAGSGALQQKVNGLAGAAAGGAISAVGGAASMGMGMALGAGSMARDAMGNAASQMSTDMASHKQSEQYFGDKLKGN